MPHPPDPPHGDDRRLAADLRERRPGAVGHVYNVYGPQLFEYAGVLLGDREQAVEAVRAALLTGPDRPETVPVEPEKFRDWVYELVRDECLARLGITPDRPAAAPGSAEQRTVAAVERSMPTAATSVLVGPPRPPDEAPAPPPSPAPIPVPDAPPRPAPSAREAPGQADEAVAALVALGSPRRPTDLDGHQTGRTFSGPGEAPTADPFSPEPPTAEETAAAPVSAAPAAANGASSRVHRARLLLIGVASAAAVVLTGLLVLAPGPTDGPPATGAAAAPSTTAPPPPPPPTPSKSPEQKKTKKPEKRATRAASERPRLVIGDSGCRGIRVTVLGARCTIRLTARGGTVRWSVASTTGTGVRASGGGTLAEGRSVSVPVTVTPSFRCFRRDGGSGEVVFSPGGRATVSYTCGRR